MKQLRTFILPLLALSLVACMKEQRQVAQDLGLLPEGCGSEGMRMEASINGSAFCPDMQLVAVGDDASVIITGVDIAGNTLVLQVEALEVGEHAITEAVNGVLFMQVGMTYTVPPGVEGVLRSPRMMFRPGACKAPSRHPCSMN